MNISLSITFVVLILFSQQFYNEAVILRWTNMVCQTDNTIFVQHICRLKAIKRYKTVVNFNGTLMQPVYDMKARVQVLKKENGFKPWLYDISFDVCEFLKRNNNPVIKIIYHIVKDHSNMNHTCPFVGPIIIKDLYLTTDKLPLPIPTGEYAVDINWTFNKISKLFTRYQFEFIEDL